MLYLLNISLCNARRLFIAVILVATPLLAFAVSQSETIKLGGPREAAAIITATTSEYTVVVSFLAVSAFDPSKNMALNRSKADQYVLVALGRKAGIPSGEEFSAEGLVCVESGQSNKLYAATYKIPVAGIKREGSPILKQGEGVAPSAAAPIKVESKSQLLSRSADYSHSIKEIGALVEGDFRSAARDLTIQELATGVEEAKQEAARTYDELLTEIAQDKLLLQLEAKELREEILSQQKQISADLETIRSRHEQLARQMLGL